MDIGALAKTAKQEAKRLDAARRSAGNDVAWYPYDILGNLLSLDALLIDQQRDLVSLAGGRPVADIGGADGDLAFVLEEQLGWSIDLIDTAHANINGLAGARAIAEQLNSTVRIFDIDLDTQFVLPRRQYGLVFLLGILYHLQNPYYVLRELSAHCNHLLLSTRVARVAGPDETVIDDLPVAYLVGPTETNGDSSNYWIFSPTGLRRLVERAGWAIESDMTVGDQRSSNPSSPDRDERMFMLLRSYDLPSATDRGAEI